MCVIVWGFNFTVVKYATAHGFTPLAFAGTRFGLSVAVFAVIGLTREGVSEIIAVIIPSGKPDAQAFHSHCIDLVGAGQAPGGYLFVKQFPRTSGGKVDRPRLRQQIGKQVEATAAKRPVI